MALREDQRRAFETIVKDLADDDEAWSILRTILDAKDTAKALDDAGEQRKSVTEDAKPVESESLPSRWSRRTQRWLFRLRARPSTRTARKVSPTSLA